MPAEREKILVIEDNATLALGLKLNLIAEGFEVLTAEDGHTGLKLALEARPDLLVLDLMLPGIDGLEILSHLREVGQEMRVIILSARGEERDKLRGLGLGADDYVTKPFSLKELLARIHAALRRLRQGRAAGQRVAFATFELDVGGRRVFREGVEVPLTPKEYELLFYLIDRHDRAQGRDRLLAAVWGDDYDGTARTVDNFMRSLRVKLEPDPAKPRHLTTVRGIGYRFDS